MGENATAIARARAKGKGRRASKSASVKRDYLLRRSKMLPLSLLKAAQGHPMLIELKNGETYNGHLVNCDTWMNVHLREVICTSKDGDRFWRVRECYIRGNTVKYMRVQEQVMDKAVEEQKRFRRFGQGRGGRGGRGDRGGRGGRGGRGRNQ